MYFNSGRHAQAGAEAKNLHWIQQVEAQANLRRIRLAEAQAGAQFAQWRPKQEPRSRQTQPSPAKSNLILSNNARRLPS